MEKDVFFIHTSERKNNRGCKITRKKSNNDGGSEPPPYDMSRKTP